MNTESASTTNFQVPTVIALALTATTLSNLESKRMPSLVIPHYSMQTQVNIAGENLSMSLTSTNIGESFLQTVDLENYKLLKSFGECLVSRSKEIDPQIAEIIDDNFWDLI